MIRDDTIPVKESQSPFQARPTYPQKESDLLMEESDLIQGSGPPLVPVQGESLLRVYILLLRTSVWGTCRFIRPLHVWTVKYHAEQLLNDITACDNCRAELRAASEHNFDPWKVIACVKLAFLSYICLTWYRVCCPKFGLRWTSWPWLVELIFRSEILILLLNLFVFKKLWIQSMQKELYLCCHTRLAETLIIQRVSIAEPELPYIQLHCLFVLNLTKW